MAKRGRPRRTRPLKTAVAIKSTAAYKTWLDGLAAHTGLPLVVVIDLSIREFARCRDYPVPPPPRTGE